MNELAYILTGVLVGAVLVRYGIGLGYNMCLQAREEEPLRGEKALPIEQEVTEDEYFSQEETEVL